MLDLINWCSDDSILLNILVLYKMEYSALRFNITLQIQYTCNIDAYILFSTALFSFFTLFTTQTARCRISPGLRWWLLPQRVIPSGSWCWQFSSTFFFSLFLHLVVPNRIHSALIHRNTSYIFNLLMYIANMNSRWWMPISVALKTRRNMRRLVTANTNNGHIPIHRH